MSTLLYVIVAILLLALARRAAAFSRRSAIVLVALPLLLTGRALVTGSIVAPIDLAYTAEPLASMASRVGVGEVTNATMSDVYAQFIPWNAALRWAVAHHEWPLWNPFELGGDPLAAAAQSAPYHPFTLVALLLPQASALTFAATLLFFSAALSMFLFLRDLELSELASLFGAAAWAFSTHMISFIHTAHGNSVAMLPFVLLAARRVSRRPMLLVAALVLLLLCGHPETALHVIFLGSVYALFELRRDTASRAIASAIAAGVVTLLLLAFFLLPMIDAITQTREWLHRTSATEGPRAARASWNDVAEILPRDVVPFVAKYDERLGWAGSGYAGSLLFALAAIALWRRRNRRTLSFAALFVFGCLMGAAVPGLTDLFARLPLFSISLTERMIVFAPFAMATLAAIGIDAIERDDAWFFLVAGLLLVLAANDAGAFRAIAPLLLAFALLRVVPQRFAPVALLALLLLQRGGETRELLPIVPRAAFYPPIEGLASLPHDDRDPYRIVGQGTLLTPNIAAHYELEDVRGYQAMTLAPLAATFPLWCEPQPVWSNRVDDLTAPMLSLMNVRYALAPPKKPAPDGWRELGAFPGFTLLENMRALPRAFVPHVVHAANDASTIEAMKHCTDFGQDAWIDGASEATNGNAQIAMKRHGSRLRLAIAASQPTWVVVSEPAWRGWRAFEGDRELPLAVADAAFIAFHVGAGDHDVRLAYHPRSLDLGAAISAATCALLIAYAILRRRRDGKLLGS